MAIVENISSEQGDILRISTDSPIIGLMTLNSFIDNIEGEVVNVADSLYIEEVTLNINASEFSTFTLGLVDTLYFTDTFKDNINELLNLSIGGCEVGKTYLFMFKVNQNSTKKFQFLFSNDEVSTSILSYSKPDIDGFVELRFTITFTSTSQLSDRWTLSIKNIDVLEDEFFEFKDWIFFELTDNSFLFKKEFQWSVDGGINFNNWRSLNTASILEVDISTKSNFVFQFKYTRVGSGSGDLIFNSINLDGDFIQNEYKIYNKTFFKGFFELDDINVLNWAVNVLEKVYGNGIMPFYVERGDDDSLNGGDKDFLDYFGTTTHFFAVIVNYARQFRDISTNQILLEEFIRSRGLIVSKDATLQELSNIYVNYIQEYRKRGTVQITNPKTNDSEIDGELLRLINYIDTDEFIFALLEREVTGWCLGKSSPTWTGTELTNNLTKGYEKTESVNDLSKYPLINNQYISLSVEEGVQCLKISGDIPDNTKVGIGDWSQVDKMIKVNSALDYEVYFKIKDIGEGFDKLNFEILGFDISKNLISLNSITNNSNSYSLFSSLNNYNIFKKGEWYWFRGVVYNSGQSLNINNKLNFRNGRALRFKNNVKYIMPRITITGTNENKQVFIKDIKIKPLNLNFSQGQLGIKNIIMSYLNNKGEYSTQDFLNFCREKLLPYNSEFKVKFL